MPNSENPSPSKDSLEIATMLLHQQESDRGCVIFSAAILEDDLESLLRACCLSDQTAAKKIVDPLFRGYAPLSTFAAKIQVSYAFGLIRERLYSTLTLIRKLRNDFAHEKQSVSFQYPKYQKALLAILKSAESEDYKSVTKPVEPDEDEPIAGMGRLTKRQFVERLAFCIAVSNTSARLQVIRDIQLEIRKAHRPQPSTKP